MLKTSSSLKTLSLANNALGRGALEAMASMLDGDGTLVSLDVSANELNDEAAMQQLATIFNAGCSLTDLSLAANNITAAALEPLIVALKSNSLLRRLDLASNDLAHIFKDPPPAFSNVTHKGKTAVVKGEKAEVEGVERAVQWIGNSIGNTNGSKTITSVEDKIGGKVSLNDGGAFKNPGLPHIVALAGNNIIIILIQACLTS